MITYDVHVLIGTESEEKTPVVKCHDTGVNLRVYPETEAATSKWRKVVAPYRIPEGAMPLLKITKPDGNWVTTEARTVGDTWMLFELPPQTFTVAGICTAEVAIYSAEGERLTTDSFSIEVPQELIHDGEEGSTSYADVVAEQIANAAKREAAKVVDSKLDKNQGTDNAGRVLLVGEDGGVRPTDWVQPDWNQNDSTTKDYVKNRTHWADLQYASTWLNHYEVNPLTAGIGIHPLVIAMEGKEDFSFDRFLEPERLQPILSLKITFTVASYGEMDFTDTFFKMIKFIDDYNYKSLLNSVQGYEIYCIRDVTALSEQYREMFTANGAYLRVFEGTGELKASRVAFRCLKFNQLDERYIPSSIARTADIENLPKTNEEEIALLIETDTLPAVQTADGKLLSTGGKIIMRH